MRLLPTLITFLFLTVKLFAQNDPLYNQYYFNQAMINPAYTGTHNVTNVTFLSRAQWTGIKGAPVTQTLNATSALKNERLGVGLLAINDRLGVNNNTEIQGAVAYKLVFPNSQLSFGMQGGIVNYRYDYNDLNFEVVDQPIFEQRSNFTKPTIGTGVFFRTYKYYIGLSVPRLLNINIEDGVSTSTRYKRHAYLSGGIILDRVAAIKIKPSFLLRAVQGQPLALDLNASLLFKEVWWVGFSVRNFKAIGLNSQFEINDKLRVGYSYELPFGALSGITYGTHEFMLSMDLELFSRQLALKRYF